MFLRDVFIAEEGLAAISGNQCINEARGFVYQPRSRAGSSMDYIHTRCMQYRQIFITCQRNFQFRPHFRQGEGYSAHITLRVT